MTEETKGQQYKRLLYLINDTYRDGDHLPFTPEEKRDFGNMLADNMTPWEYSNDIQDVGDITHSILEIYSSLTGIELALEFVNTFECETVDDWIRENGLPLPDADGMIEHLLSEIDDEIYINEYYDDVLNMIPNQCEFNLSDEEIIFLFETHVEEPGYDLKSGEFVICEAAEKFGCNMADCYHAQPHIYESCCDEPDCDKHNIEVKCVPVLVK